MYNDIQYSRYSYPGALWLLPIFFGLFGGIVAALVASLKYNSRWGELFIVGILTQIVFGALAWYWLVPLLFGTK